MIDPLNGSRTVAEHISRRNEIGSELLAFARFLSGLPAFVRRHMTLAEARAIIDKRLLSREANFFDVLQRGVFGNPKSPYRALLSRAGCTFDDVRELVSKEGLEGTLQI